MKAIIEITVEGDGDLTPMEIESHLQQMISSRDTVQDYEKLIYDDGCEPHCGNVSISTKLED